METAKVKKMKRHYLPFEKPLKDLDFEIEKLSNSESDNTKLNQLIDERKELEKEIFSDLSSLGLFNGELFPGDFLLINECNP